MYHNLIQLAKQCVYCVDLNKYSIVISNRFIFLYLSHKCVSYKHVGILVAFQAKVCKTSMCFWLVNKVPFIFRSFFIGIWIFLFLPFSGPPSYRKARVGYRHFFIFQKIYIFLSYSITLST